MKKIIIIFLLLFVFVFVGCKKEQEKTKEEVITPSETQVIDPKTETKEPTEDKTETVEHVHTFFEGVCSSCGYVCLHDFSDGPICKICGSVCPHVEFENGKCKQCGIDQQLVCIHTFSNGLCLKCGYECPHYDVEEGYCLDCGSALFLTCKHIFIDEVCTICKYHCPHRHYNDSKCVLCGKECFHEGVKCLETCPECKTLIEHEFENGKCVKCGAMYKLEDKAVPDKYLDKNCPEKGTVEKVVFQSYDYAKSRPYENTFFVYLPYSYYANPTKEYNIMYLLHGSGENSAYWLAQLGYAGGYTETTKVVLDNMHYYHLCEETIVCTPTSNLNGTANFYKELLNNIMPLCETLYRTKAGLYGRSVSSIKNSDFIASRESRAYAGLSRGSMIGWSIIAYDLPYFGYFGYYSGGSYGLTTYYNDARTNVAASQYLVKFAYHSCGDNDAMYSNHISDYTGLLNSSKGKLVEGKNTEFLTKHDFGHNYQSWIIDLYNSLGLRFFKY